MQKISPRKLLTYLSVSACILLVLCMTGCGSNEKIPYSKTDFYFDTVVTLTVYDTVQNADAANELLTEAMEECRRYDLLLSPDAQDSDIYRINHAGGQAVTVSDETVTLLYSAIAYCRTFPHLADITIAPVKALWDFTPGGSRIPDDAQLQDALSHVDFSQLQINGNQVTLSDSQAGVDVGFIAKGYIADRMKAFFIEKGCDKAIINLGGNVQTLGCKPDQSPFSVGIQKPFSDTGDYLTTVELGDSDSLYSSAATSGVYERCFEADGRLYHHILDPSTGMPVSTDLYSVTILTDSSTDADALSTICLAMGAKDAEAYIRSIDKVDAILITDTYQIIDTRKYSQRQK